MEPQAGPDSSNASAASAASAFGLLHPGVQRQLWRMGWKSLRPLQVDAIHAILSGEKHVILSAATASGKTEAAFLPILSRIAAEPTGSVRAMYVGPLKALINDQFTRVGDLCANLDVPVYHWHGDVSAGEKTRLVGQPGGVLLITPESLESLFVNRAEHLAGLFGGLRFVIIDELHSFLDNERGLHLRSLLSRVRQLMAELPDSTPYRVAALSATIGDHALGQRFVAPEKPDEVLVITDKAGEKELKYRVHGYSLPAANEVDDDEETEDPGAERPGEEMPDEPEPQEQGNADKPQEDPLLPMLQDMAADIVRHCAGHSNLVFANSRADVEVFADLAKRIAEQQRLADCFLVHHGSLSAVIRQDAEQTMKSGRAATTFCSSTLEMGIDIGSVRMVGQIGPSWSVTSQLQRMGRSGRKEGEPRIMRVYIESQEPGSKASIFDRLHLPLVQAAAITELMLAHRLEPPRPPCCDLSTLTQQIISAISETGGLPAETLHDRLCRRGAFGDVEPAVFTQLLRRLGGQDVIEQMPGGDLILGLKGERLRKDKGFYACFPTDEEFAVIHEAQVLGTIQTVPRPRDHLLFAGRRWIVLDVDTEHHEIHVKPARGWKRPKFTGGPGEVHPMVRQKMRGVLAGTEALSYLDNHATELLDHARRAAAEAGACTRCLLELGRKRSALMTWTGSRIQETLAAMFHLRGLKCGNEGIALTFEVPADSVRDAMKELETRPWNPLELARLVQLRQRRKYDWLLGDELLDICIGRGVLDCDGAGELLRDLFAAAGIRSAARPPSASDGGAAITFTPGPAAQPSVTAEPVGTACAKPRNPIEIIATQDAFTALCSDLAHEPILALDVETTIWDKPRLLCTMQLATPRQTWFIDVLALKDLGPIVPILGSADIVKIIHYADFEREVFAERGIAIQNVFDTCEASRALRPGETGHSLADCVLRELGLRMDKTFQKADWKRRPLPQALIEYAALDAEILIALRAKLPRP
jgi:ATP-dependent Lhr-like helicase